MSIGYGIACIIIYSTNENINCTTKGISIIYCATPCLNGLIFGIKNKQGAIAYFSYIFLLSFPFNIAWSILGSVMLFKYSMNCVSNALWQVALSCLIFHWITIVFILWEIRNKYTRIPKITIPKKENIAL